MNEIQSALMEPAVTRYLTELAELGYPVVTYTTMEKHVWVRAHGKDYTATGHSRNPTDAVAEAARDARFHERGRMP